MLSPPRSFHKKKYELGLEPLTYLSYPIFVRDDGSWRKRKDKKEGAAATAEKEQKEEVGKDGDGQQQQQQQEEEEEEEDADVAKGKASNAATPTTATATEKDGQASAKSEPSVEDDRRPGSEYHKGVHDGVVGVDSGHTNDDDDDERGETKSTASDDDRKAMSMFNVVFIMNPPLLEHNLRVKEMFEYVVKKFAKVLKYEQARSNWVWRQSEMILNMKERAKEESMFL
jgi:hypothetical protein